MNERLYALLVRLLYPRDFRRQYGADLRELFRDHLRAARRRSGWRGVAMLWFRAVPDLFTSAFSEHEDEMLHALAQDARYAVRILRKNPVFALVAIAVVALGTGAVSTIFSVANAIVLRPIPVVARPNELYNLQRRRRDGAGSTSASFPYYKHLAANSKTMAGIAAVDMMPITISTGGEGLAAFANLVTGNYFNLLGVQPQLGRFFAKDEDVVPDANPVVVISDELWHRRFAGDSAVVGKSVLLNGRQFTVIGVAPAKFRGLYPILRIDAWVPMMMQSVVRRGGPSLLTSAGSMWLDLFGRTAPGVDQETASAELSGLTRQFADAMEQGMPGQIASINQTRMTRVSGLPSDATRSVVAFFVVLLVVSGLVLLIASVNVASMLLARAVARRREIAVRIALGAGRMRLVRQLLTESVLLFTTGGALGVVFAVATTRLLSRIPLPTDVPIAIDASPDVRVLVVTIGVALVTGIVFGLAPALQGSRGDVAVTLRGDNAAAGRTRSRLRNVLVAGQVAASLLLLTASGLFVRALARGHQIDPGYDVNHVTTSALDVSLSGYDTTRQRAFYTTLRQRVARLPGVTAVTYTRVVPLSMNNSGYDISVPGYVAPRGGSSGQWSYANLVDARYFETLRMPILAGRGIAETDNQHAPPVAVVSEFFAKRYWPGQNALGKTFKLDSTTTVTVVGVTKDVKFARLDERPGPFMYLPLAQRWRPDVNLLVRTSGDAVQLIAPIQAEVRAIDPNLPAPVTITMERSAATVLLPQRFAVIVTASLGVAGLILAAIGLYGVLSFSTAQRTREIGVRMALGATREAVLRMIVREGMRVVVAGVAVGLVLAAFATRALVPFLFGVNPLDVTTFAAMTAILGATALAASFLPARRAANGDPMSALRQD